MLLIDQKGPTISFKAAVRTGDAKCTLRKNVAWVCANLGHENNGRNPNRMTGAAWGCCFPAPVLMGTAPRNCDVPGLPDV